MKSFFSRRLFFLSAIFSLSLLQACGGGGGGSAGSTGSGNSSSNNNGGNVSAQSVGTTIGTLNVGSSASVSFSGSSASVSFSDLTGSERFVVTLFSESTATSSYPTRLSGSESLAPADENGVVSAQLLKNFKKEEENENTITEDFHEKLREAEAALPLEEIRQQHTLSLSAVDHISPELSIGDTRSIKVLNSLSNTSDYSTRTGRLVYQTARFDFYVDTEDQGALSTSDVQSMADELEAHATKEYATFGSVSDIDDNGKVNVFYTHILNGLAAGGIVTGYFFGGDLYDTYPSSNMGEFIYCHVPDDSGAHGVAIPHSFFMSNTGPLCAYHELQHAINFNMKVFVNGGSPEPGPFNEGRSHLAEDLHNDFLRTSNENPSRVQLCLSSSAIASFASGTGLAQRGCSYLFHLYLYEQANNGRFSGISNGAALIYRTSNTALTGLDAITSATGETVESLVSDFFTAVYLSNTGLSSNPRYNFSNINLRAAQDDNRGTVLSGPSVTTASSLPASGSIPGLSAAYFLVSGSTLSSAGNTLNISTTSSDMNPGARLIRIGDE
ncbi:MAG: hypothetical protein HQM15_11180 [Deltaproteobacteria bacterium]|nr:hypothetical protein [Deltaproteobacteria bacterium]